MGFRENLVIPEPKHRKALRFNFTVTTFVRHGTLLVLATVNFNYEFRFDTSEVGNITANRYLPAESMASELLAPQILPKVALGIRGLLL